jgi:hypothetical protein
MSAADAADRELDAFFDGLPRSHKLVVSRIRRFLVRCPCAGLTVAADINGTVIHFTRNGKSVRACTSARLPDVVRELAASNGT